MKIERFDIINNIVYLRIVSADFDFDLNLGEGIEMDVTRDGYLDTYFEFENIFQLFYKMCTNLNVVSFRHNEYLVIFLQISISIIITEVIDIPISCGVKIGKIGKIESLRINCDFVIILLPIIITRKVP